METALYLLPVTLGDTPVETVLPSYNKEVILGIRHFIVEDVRSARRFLKKVDREIDIDSLTFYTLNKHTSPEDISGYLKPLEAGNPMGVISEAGCPAVADPGADYGPRSFAEYSLFQFRFCSPVCLSEESCTPG